MAKGQVVSLNTSLTDEVDRLLPGESLEHNKLELRQQQHKTAQHDTVKTK